ncbi:MAG: hypothetical protein M3464_12720 [Chloroflexota bacterium]|nr:hypothetical protein [Chloroflexota bacterium]
MAGLVGYIVSVLIVLRILFAPGEIMAQESAGAATPAADGQGVVGAWVVTVATSEGFAFPVFQIYEAGGTVLSPFLPAFQAEPGDPVETIYTSPGVGAWEQAGPDTYAGTIAIAYGDVDGHVLAIETVRWDLELDETGDAFTGTSTFVGADPAGDMLYEGVAILTGTRITVQEPGVPVAVPAGGGSAATPAP